MPPGVGYPDKDKKKKDKEKAERLEFYKQMARMGESEELTIEKLSERKGNLNADKYHFKLEEFTKNPDEDN